MSYDTPLTPQGQQISQLPLKEQLRRGFKDMGTRSYSSAKNFALVGAIFSGTECCIEGVCGKYPSSQLRCPKEKTPAEPRHHSSERRTISPMASPQAASPVEPLERGQVHKLQLSDVPGLQPSVRPSTTTCGCRPTDATLWDPVPRLED